MTWLPDPSLTKEALDELFAPFGGVRAALPTRVSSRHCLPTCATTLMESCTGGNFTRWVFQVTGYAALCRRYGAEPVYLDGITGVGSDGPRYSS